MLLSAWLPLAVLGATHVAAADCPNDLKTPYPSPSPKDGWSVRLVANSGLSKPRSILFDTSGALLVLDQNVGVVRMVLEDHGGSCVTVANSTTVVGNKDVSVAIPSIAPIRVSEVLCARSRERRTGGRRRAE